MAWNKTQDNNLKAVKIQCSRLGAVYLNVTELIEISTKKN